ncbi:MAG TPA: glycosyltransferase family 9 protein [Nitrospiraceae bacterium]|nr:glycosyltransferase family 9 protein [Nitrospiraceae bacterium]
MIHPGGLGDVLLAVPAMVRLRNRFPNHWLVLCAENQPAKLLLACRIIDAWTPVQGQACAELFAGADSVTGQLRGWLGNCDLAIAWMQDVDGNLSEILKVFGAREVIVRSPFSTTIQATHQRDRFLEAIHEEASSVDGGDALLRVTEPLLYLGQACLEAKGLVIGQRLVVIHPGSGSAHKSVHPATIASLVVALQDFGVTPVVLEGPADRAPVERLLQLCVNPPTVLRDLDILTVAGVLAQTQLFVGHDSGVTHLAGLIGLRTVALFGPTDPNRWAPRGTHVAVVEGAPCLCHSWDEVRRCENKPCLDIPEGHLVSLCLVCLKQTPAR